MRKLQLALLTILAIASLSIYNWDSKTVDRRENALFKSWTQKFGKQYTDLAEEEYRMTIWMRNWAYVQVHNAQYEAGQETYNLQMNEFADLTSEQFGARYLIDLSGEAGVTSKCTGSQAPTLSLPEELDWSAKGAVTNIKNQGQCGSCWAFSTTGSLEGAHFLKTGSLESYSEQHLVDCSHSYGNNGCGGGLMNLSFFYIKDNGIALESKYPYKGVGGSCHYNATTDKAWTITDCTEVTEDKELSLKAAVALNPVSVAIQANHLSFQLYKSGVYSGNCGTKLDHGVLAVGYGSLSGKGYWKVKNSWGSGWGDKGYIFIERTGDGKGKCGIQMAASYPIA